MTAPVPVTPTEARAVLAEILALFTERGHPGRPCLRTPWTAVETVERWRVLLAALPAEPAADARLAADLAYVAERLRETYTQEGVDIVLRQMRATARENDDLRARLAEVESICSTAEARPAFRGFVASAALRAALSGAAPAPTACAYGPCSLPVEPGGRAYCTLHGVAWGRGQDAPQPAGEEG